MDGEQLWNNSWVDTDNAKIAPTGDIDSQVQNLMNMAEKQLKKWNKEIAYKYYLNAEEISKWKIELIANMQYQRWKIAFDNFNYEAAYKLFKKAVEINPNEQKYKKSLEKIKKLLDK